MTFHDPDTSGDSWHEPRPVTMQVNKPTIERLLTALEDHLENTRELLAKHLEGLGETISKNKVVADMYREQIEEAEMLIEELER